jgi:uncharacterized protein (DUF2147 family)
MLGYLVAAAFFWRAVEPDLAGSWTNTAGTVVVLIAPCAEGGWCGTVQWASEKAKADAARAGTATLVGAEILHRFVPAGGKRWKGRLFVPDLRQRSKAEIRLVEPDRLRVRGCAVGGLICRSQLWTRTATLQPERT